MEALEARGLLVKVMREVLLQAEVVEEVAEVAVQALLVETVRQVQGVPGVLV